MSREGMEATLRCWRSVEGRHPEYGISPSRPDFRIVQDSSVVIECGHRTAPGHNTAQGGRWKRAQIKTKLTRHLRCMVSSRTYSFTYHNLRALVNPKPHQMEVLRPKSATEPRSRCPWQSSVGGSLDEPRRQARRHRLDGVFDGRWRAWGVAG